MNPLNDWHWKHVEDENFSSTSNGEHDWGNRKIGKRKTTSNYHLDTTTLEISFRTILSLFSSRFNCIAYYVSIACLLCVDTTVYILITQRLITKLMSNIFLKSSCSRLHFSLSLLIWLPTEARNIISLAKLTNILLFFRIIFTQQQTTKTKTTTRRTETMWYLFTFIW